MEPEFFDTRVSRIGKLAVSQAKLRAECCSLDIIRKLAFEGGGKAGQAGTS